MSESNLNPPTDWVTLRHGGEEIAEAWYMPEGDGFTLVALVGRRCLESDRPVTVETLWTAAGVPADAVESWRLGDAETQPGRDEPLPLPPADEDQLTVYIRLRPAAPSTDVEDDGSEVPLEKWQALDAVWSGVLGLESAIEAARLGMEGLRGEMEAAFRKALATEEKLNALQADVANWNKAKSRIHHILPKAREFAHKATWALGVPERKALGELVRTHVEPRVRLPGVDRVRERMEHLQKERQVLLAQGNAVAQECRGILAGCNTALGQLQRNAADRARQKRSAGREKGKHF